MILECLYWHLWNVHTPSPRITARCKIEYWVTNEAETQLLHEEIHILDEKCVLISGIIILYKKVIDG